VRKIERKSQTYTNSSPLIHDQKVKKRELINENERRQAIGLTMIDLS